MNKKAISLEKKITPIVKNVFKGMGEKSVSTKKAQKIEREMIDDFMKKSFPELGIGLDVLYEWGILNDERYEELKENPEALLIMIQRWLPMIQRLAPQLLKGKSVQQAAKTEFDL